MTDTKQFAETTQDQTLSIVRQGQDTVVKAVEAWSETVRQMVPASGKFYDESVLPEPRELVDEYFNFVEQWLSVQREFAHSVLNASAPALQAAAHAAQSTATTARKGAAKAKSA
ncbi:MAG: hypothetical protein ACR2MA_05995 [Egibacteraceae bacterium]